MTTIYSVRDNKGKEIAFTLSEESARRAAEVLLVEEHLNRLWIYQVDLHEREIGLVRYAEDGPFEFEYVVNQGRK